MDWATYVRSTTHNDRQVDIAARTGVIQTTISRWLTGKQQPATAAAVADFARAYDRPVLEAFVAAGFLTESDARVRVVKPRSLDGFTVDELLAEVAARTKRGADVS